MWSELGLGISNRTSYTNRRPCITDIHSEGYQFHDYQGGNGISQFNIYLEGSRRWEMRLEVVVRNCPSHYSSGIHYYYWVWAWLSKKLIYSHEMWAKPNASPVKKAILLNYIAVPKTTNIQLIRNRGFKNTQKLLVLDVVFVSLCRQLADAVNPKSSHRIFCHLNFHFRHGHLYWYTAYRTLSKLVLMDFI